MFIRINKFESCGYIINKFLQLPLIHIKVLVNKFHSIRYAEISALREIHCVSWIWLTHAVAITVGFTYTNTRYLVTTQFTLIILLLLIQSAAYYKASTCTDCYLVTTKLTLIIFALLIQSTIKTTVYTAYHSYTSLLVQTIREPTSSLRTVCVKWDCTTYASL